MKSKYSLRYLPAANDDLIGILDYIAKDSPARALQFIERIEKQIGRLEVHPYLGQVPRYPKLQAAGYRVLVVENYLVFYIVRGQTVEVHRVLHGSRHYKDLL